LNIYKHNSIVDDILLTELRNKKLKKKRKIKKKDSNLMYFYCQSQNVSSNANLEELLSDFFHQIPFFATLQIPRYRKLSNIYA